MLCSEMSGLASIVFYLFESLLSEASETRGAAKEPSLTSRCAFGDLCGSCSPSGAQLLRQQSENNKRRPPLKADGTVLEGGRLFPLKDSCSSPACVHSSILAEVSLGRTLRRHQLTRDYGL